MFCTVLDVFELLPGFDLSATSELIENSIKIADSELRTVVSAKYALPLEFSTTALKTACSLLSAVYAIGMSYTGGGEDGPPALMNFYQERYNAIIANILQNGLFLDNGEPVPTVGSSENPVNGGIWFADMLKNRTCE